MIAIDSLSDYYDINLKKDRLKILKENELFLFIKGEIEKEGLLQDIFTSQKPDLVIHLAAQAGVRYSLENPRSYVDSNIIGTFELLEAAKAFPPRHLLFASTSSVYGSNTERPYLEKTRTDHPLSFYAATKKSNEAMAHSYAHLFKIPITLFRFFTVYGPWGRPDMAIFKFTKAILEGKPIEVYNFGNLKRDFTYISDLVEAIALLIEKVPNSDENVFEEIDSISSVAPFRIINIGNSKPVTVLEFIEAIEKHLGKQSIQNLVEMQKGDVLETFASIKLLQNLTGFTPKINIDLGVKQFIEWYRNYYNV